MKKELLLPGTKVTLLSKGVPFANTEITRVRMKFGEPLINVKGYYDDFGQPEDLRANEVRELTNGWYDKKPDEHVAFKTT